MHLNMLEELMKNGKKMKTIKYGAFQISKNPETSIIMRRSRGSHKLTDYMNYIGNIRASKSEID